MSMLNKYDYSKVDRVCYSDTEQVSYKKAAEFLGDTVEDWGCGTCWAEQYFVNYTGIDGSPSRCVKPEDVVDLVEYTSSVDNILLRHVLEANKDWEKLLENIKKSFKKKFCLVVFTPTVEKTYIYKIHPVVDADGNIDDTRHIYEMFFNKQDILNFFPEEEFIVSHEEIKTNSGYGTDWIVYVERR